MLPDDTKLNIQRSFLQILLTVNSNNLQYIRQVMDAVQAASESHTFPSLFVAQVINVHDMLPRTARTFQIAMCQALLSISSVNSYEPNLQSV